VKLKTSSWNGLLPGYFLSELSRFSRQTVCGSAPLGNKQRQNNSKELFCNSGKNPLLKAFSSICKTGATTLKTV